MVRILEGRHGTESITRALITTSDGNGEWSTVGVGENVIAASCEALQESFTYGLLHSAAHRAADAEESRTYATLVVTLTNTPGALRRVTASLGTIPVTELTYAASLASRGTARITLPWKSADRARNKLNRLVEVLAVTDAAP